MMIEYLGSGKRQKHTPVKAGTKGNLKGLKRYQKIRRRQPHTGVRPARLTLDKEDARLILSVLRRDPLPKSQRDPQLDFVFHRFIDFVRYK